MKTYMSIAMMILTAGIVTAQIDPDPDGMSVYFDTEGLSFCHETGGASEEVTAYFLLTHPSWDLIMAWEAHVKTDVVALYLDNWFVVNGQYYPDPYEDFVIGCIPNLQVEGTSVVLMHRTIHFQGDSAEHAIFTVRGVEGSTSFSWGHPGYAPAPGVPVPCNLIHDSPGDPVAWINHPDACAEVIANADLTWGAVKRLY